MKKKFLSFLLVFVLVLSLAPNVLAATDLGSAPVELDISNGSISVVSSAQTVTYTQGENVYTSTGGCIVTQNDPTVTANRIDLSGAKGSMQIKLTIAGLNIESEESPIALLGNANVLLTLVGTNRLVATNGAGIEVETGKTLTIGGFGSLSATGGDYGAGIGGGDGGNGGSITITGGTVTATGSAAGIGGSCRAYSNGGTITITGGTVTATGGDDGAGIGGGGGSYSAGGIIIITGGTVTATGGHSGAGIGGGDYGDGGTITISGGTVTATGGTYAAGIGGGYGGDGGTVTITGGTVTATSGSYAAGIGGGIKGDGGCVTISSAKVIVKGYFHAIGGGSFDNQYGCDNIEFGENVILDLSFTNVYGGGSLYQERIDINAACSAAAHSGNVPNLCVDAYGFSGLTYQWQVKNGESWEDVPNQTNAEANITMSQENDGATYRCAITNGWGNTIYTDEVQSYILAFSKQPQSVQTNLNEITALAVTSTCSNVTYQWQRSYDGETWADVPGKTAPTLVLSTTHSENGAYYRCVITATNGDALASDAAQITVNSNEVTYKTEYYLQSADGTYAMTERVSTEAEAGASVTAPEKQFDHYTEVTTKGIHSGTVAADGSLTLSRYYDRVSYTISFVTNGGAELPDITAMHGAAVSLPASVSRRGYTFGGWYLDEALTREANLTAMPMQDTTLYAKWTAVGEGRGQEYQINGITLLGSDYEPTQGVPASGFWAQVSVTNLCSESMDTLILTAYDADGRVQNMYFLCADPQVGQTFTLGVWIDNSDGKIAELRAIVIPMLGGSMIPLSNGVGTGD